MSEAGPGRCHGWDRAVGDNGPVLMTAARPVRERLVRRLPDDWPWGWLGPVLVATFAGVLRFWRLGTPKAFIFDETYYAKDGFALLHYGVEQNYVTRPKVGDFANQQILAGHLGDLFAGQPAYVVHPPAGKWMIALGEWAFGMTPFGWRFAAAVTGTLSVLMLARIGRRLFGSTLLGCTAGLLMSVDGLHYVHSRAALLDPLLMFWVLAAFGALLVDRDRARARLAGWLTTGSAAGGPEGLAQRARHATLGPALGLRPWRLAAGVFLGLACATKWSGLWFVVVFGLMTVLWDLGARRTAGVPRPWLSTLVRDAGPAFVSLVVVAAAVYLLSWTGWFLGGKDAYLRDWAATNPGNGLVPDALRSLWHYHQDAWRFHTGLHSFHPYRSNPWGWLVLARPVSYYYQSTVSGQGPCDADQCSQAITALGTPAIWWASVAALAVVAYLWLGRRDWRAGAILSGVAAGYLPWFFFQGRTVYSFYAVVFLPWLVLAITLCLGLLLGPADAPERRRRWGAAAAGGYVLLAVANFAWLLPVLSAQVIPYADWANRMWLRSWI
jgi:dolichyl-phosphate-mannose--protein O-mannosyl transferase